MKDFNYQCPLGKQKIIDQEKKINGVIVALLMLGFVISGQILIPIILAIDFFLRGFTRSSISIFKPITQAILKTFKAKPITINGGPKKFAAKIGFIMCLCIVAFHLAGFRNFSLTLSIILIFCASLEWFFNYCIGCTIYSLFNKDK